MIEYLTKLHMAKRYQDLSITLKSLYAPLAERFARWSEQDDYAAGQLYQDLISLERYSVNGLQHLPIILPDYANDDGDDVDLREIVDDVRCAETIVQKILEPERSQYAKVSLHRISTMEHMLNLLDKQGIYSSFGEKTLWECSQCGTLLITDKDHTNKSGAGCCYAPDECFCCHASSGLFLRHKLIAEW